jgi:outer membrane protein assembly factor BamB
MRLFGLITAASLAFSAPVFADEADWVSDYSNPQYSYSLNITTQPANYHQVWEVPLQPDPNAKEWWTLGFTIANGKFFYGLRTYHQTRGHLSTSLIALDTTTGKTLWTTNPDYSFMPPVYQNGKLFIQKCCEVPYSISAYQIDTGNVIYTFNLPDKISYVIPSENKAYFDINHHTTGEMSLITGDIIWQKTLMPGMYFSSFSLNKRNIITSDFDAIRMIDNLSGIERYKFWVPDANRYNYQPDKAVVNDDYAFAIFVDDSTSRTGTLYAFDLQKLTIKWKLPAQQNRNHLVLTHKLLFSFAPGAKKINAINIDTGRIEWTWDFPADDTPTYGGYAVVASADTVFIAAKNHVYAVSLQTHEIVWKHANKARTLALGDNKLFIVGTSDITNTDAKLTLTAIALK